jgi:hypothetical protein
LKIRKFYQKGFIGEFKELIRFKKPLVLPLFKGLLPDLYGLLEQFTADIPESI